ncbi:MAG: hypothetical protein GY804_07230 [Alphaproteobacteria bacterium]|nr:hypothetical protein [Alphaproteobacteria bacterium]
MTKDNENETKPENVPEKFWDEEKGEIRIEELLKSYKELEKKVGGMVKMPVEDSSDEDFAALHKALGVPESVDGYEIVQRHELLSSDQELNERLRMAGFTPKQAQLVYDLAAERVVPVLESLAAEYEADNQRRHLEEHFGSEEKWEEVSRQLHAWAEQNVSEETLNTLGSSYEGVLALYSMMQSSEPSIGKSGSYGSMVGLNEESLRKMMQDPKYWRDKNPEYISKISEGFKRLYPD